MKNTAVILSSLLFLTGCSIKFNPDSPYHKLYTSSMFQSVSDQELCQSIHKMPACLPFCYSEGSILDNSYAQDLRGVRKHNLSVIYDAIEKRGILNKRDLSLIPQESYGIGMTQCGMYIVLGIPTTENKSVYSFGIHIQHVYPGTYVYTEDGIVTSYQTSK